MAKHTYEYDIDLESDVAPARVIRMVERESRVLEIGAGPGSITRHLSGSLSCEVVALEVDKSAIEILRPFAKTVHAKDLNDPNWASEIEAEEGKFDYVIAADVLEHVYDPWSVLAGMKSLLNDKGSVILSLPHVGHAAVAACVLDEDFDYRPWGLLDKTHVRFFGVKNVQALYESQGMAIEQAEFVVRPPLMTEFSERWRRMPEDVQTALQRNRFSHVFQVVSRAVPKERATRELSLMELDVPPPEPEVEQEWERVMQTIPLPEDRDVRSTMIPADQLVRRASPVVHQKKPRGLLRKLFAGRGTG